MRASWLGLALLLAAGCEQRSMDVAGLVVGSGGLPVEGALVVVEDGPAVTTGADGRFLFRDVRPPYGVMVGVSQPIFQRAFAAAWVGLRRRDPVLALGNSWPQGGARYSLVCGAAAGPVTFPAVAPWVLLEPGSPFGAVPTPGHVDPASGTYCGAAGWTGPPGATGTVHVLAVDSAAGTGSDFTATAFPAAGALAGLALADGGRLDGADVALAPLQAAALRVEATGPAAAGAFLFVAAWYGSSWPGGGIPLASQLGPAPWPVVAVPVQADVRVRATVWSTSAAGASWRERTLPALAATASLDLRAAPTLLEPAADTAAAPGTRFRWAPVERGAVFSLRVIADATASSPYTELVVHGNAPDLRLPDFRAVGVPLPSGALGGWQARSVGPIDSLDRLATAEHLGLALHHGLGEDEWFTAVSTQRPLVFP